MLEEDHVLISSSSFDTPQDYRKHFDANWRPNKVELLPGEELGTQNVIVEILELDFLSTGGSIIKVCKIHITGVSLCTC